jgi:hypothetical protein
MTKVEQDLFCQWFILKCGDRIGETRLFCTELFGSVVTRSTP